MTEVEIPFLESFRDVMVQGRKTWTSHTRQYGKAGDTFKKFGKRFKILRVFKRILANVAEHWREEGCKSKADFITVWRQIHYVRGYQPMQKVFVHEFKKID